MQIPEASRNFAAAATSVRIISPVSQEQGELVCPEAQSSHSLLHTFTSSSPAAGAIAKAGHFLIKRCILMQEHRLRDHTGKEENQKEYEIQVKRPNNRAKVDKGEHGSSTRKLVKQLLT